MSSTEDSSPAGETAADPYRVLADGTVEVAPEDDSPERRRQFAVRKQMVLAGVFAWSVIQGVLVGLGIGIDGLGVLLLNLPLLVLGVSWCHLDAAERRYTIPFTLRLGLILIFGLALIVYLFESRGIRGFVSVVLAALTIMASWGLMQVTQVMMITLSSS
ncbi:MAG: hypothetical protein U0795_13685 [Pirellulales bacterium]